MGQPVTLCGTSFWTAVESATEEDARLGLRDVQTSRNTDDHLPIQGVAHEQHEGVIHPPEGKQLIILVCPFFRGPQKSGFPFWFSSKTTNIGVSSKTHTSIGSDAVPNARQLGPGNCLSLFWSDMGFTSWN